MNTFEMNKELVEQLRNTPLLPLTPTAIEKDGLFQKMAWLEAANHQLRQDVQRSTQGTEDLKTRLNEEKRSWKVEKEQLKQSIIQLQQVCHQLKEHYEKKKALLAACQKENEVLKIESNLQEMAVQSLVGKVVLLEHEALSAKYEIAALKLQNKKLEVESGYLQVVQTGKEKENALLVETVEVLSEKVGSFNN